MADQNENERIPPMNPVDFTDALKWYAIAKEKQNDYDDAIAKLKESMEANMKLHQDLNNLMDTNTDLNQELDKLKNKLQNVQTDAETETNTLRDNKKTNAEYLVHLLRDAGRNVRELRVVFREPDQWEEDEDGVF